MLTLEQRKAVAKQVAILAQRVSVTAISGKLDRLAHHVVRLGQRRLGGGARGRIHLVTDRRTKPGRLGPIFGYAQNIQLR